MAAHRNEAVDLAGPAPQDDRHLVIVQTLRVGLAFIGEDVVTRDGDKGRGCAGKALALSGDTRQSPMSLASRM